MWRIAEEEPTAAEREEEEEEEERKWSLEGLVAVEVL